ncbi:lytic transglycosylase domain-containing protein [Oryzomicrobium sp.]|uniref:lytic transglycosylase domain-containing protein n=1 Tax=Oryzomicrobium sp. TaxID=1911578 RepID=UPI002FDF1D04
MPSRRLLRRATRFAPLVAAARLSFVLALAPLTCNTALAQSDDDRLLAAKDAARLGDRAKLTALASDLQGSELGAYPTYWLLSATLKRPGDVDDNAIRAFLTREDGTYLADKLRGEWLKQLGRYGRWSVFDAEYPKLVQGDPELNCYALQSRLARGDAAALDDARALWLTQLEVPEGCQPVLNALVTQGKVGTTDVWARVRRQVETGKQGAARATLQYLPEGQTPSAKLFDLVLDKPLPYLIKQPAGSLDGRTSRELAVLALARIAKNDPAMAAEQLDRLGARLTPEDRAYAWAYAGWQAAFRLMPEALGYYRKADAALGKPLAAPLVSDDALAFRTRAALRAQDWGEVLRSIEAMAPAQAAQPEWVYWLGRAKKAGGQLEAANALFARLSGQPHFYGTLADEEMGRSITVPPKARPASPEELAKAGANPAFRRALALNRLGLRTEAVREWNWGTRGLSDRDLLAAAEVARRAEFYDRAIYSAEKTRGEHDFSLRYLAPYADQVRPAARSAQVDEAWVYGLMRQESRFVTGARSSVGASGLMQLMPATARWVAKKIGLADYHPGRVTDTEVNLMLGTSYLRLVKESLDNHPVLASAAYNAGPGRARKWKDVKPLEGAVYAETIPFSETRDYVKKVMNNAVYYGALFDGTPPSLKRLLGTVAPRGGADASLLEKGEELP